MCISVDQAEFSGSTLYAGRLRHPLHGLVHVLGYQNTAVNLADGPNAMLLHLPAYRMGRENFLPAGRSSDVLGRMVDAVRPVAAGMPSDIAWMSWGAGDEVEVFDHDIYTVLLASDATALPAALARVPSHRRPALNPLLLRFYANHYAGHAIVVCCFDNAEAARAKPLIMWYSPHDPDRLSLPSLDCHTGEPPEFTTEVAVDHWVLFGTDEAPEEWGESVDHDPRMRHRLRQFLPDSVMGARFDGSLPNGDFSLTHGDLLAGRLDRIQRLRPSW
ncbi:hypothetical protein [Streptomyces sp. NBC_01237]|uniref:hypothetical protein n=1 Tax=Streptomyces sp. NBC_01237 TaxID=2903790 RepID=UPI002DD96147|nr:hypothetical protein [Streptomyces sp. NBC_01237]WRZ70667.1 hypothetical protein OG251_03045 [Streptomyces sp. NBC_01237]